MNRIFGSAEWRQAYNKHWNYAPEKIQLYDAFERDVIKRFEQYQMPLIELKKETPKEAVCLVFERVNTGRRRAHRVRAAHGLLCGRQLSASRRLERAREAPEGAAPVLRNLQSDDFLQAISLLVTQTRRRDALDAGTTADKAPGISCKRKDILKLEVGDWKAWADRVEAGFVRAARFLYGQKIFKARDLPYRTQLVPLAAIFVDLGKDGETEGARQKIARYYWCGVLGELYGGAIESRFARDLPEVVAMVRGEAVEPITIQESSFQANRLLTLRTRNSSAYKGLYALLMRDGGRDFRTGEPIEAQTFFDDKIDIHHIFPEKWCKTAGIEPGTYNSVINKTAISARTNRQIGGKAPSKYLPAVEKAAGVEPDGWTRSSARTASRPSCCAPTGSGSSTRRAPRRCSSASRPRPARASHASRSCSAPGSWPRPTTKGRRRSGTPRIRSRRRRHEAAAVSEVQAEWRRVATASCRLQWNTRRGLAYALTSQGRIGWQGLRFDDSAFGGGRRSSPGTDFREGG